MAFSRGAKGYNRVNIGTIVRVMNRIAPLYIITNGLLAVVLFIA